MPPSHPSTPRVQGSLKCSTRSLFLPLVRLKDDQATFTYNKDNAQGARVRHMTLSAEEFIRRFLLHILPHRFVRIRYYGLLAQSTSRPGVEEVPGVAGSRASGSRARRARALANRLSEGHRPRSDSLRRMWSRPLAPGPGTGWSRSGGKVATMRPPARSRTASDPFGEGLEQVRPFFRSAVQSSKRNYCGRRRMGR
jgi:hypothetical protein